jgi:hypothetical protein
VQKAVDGRPSRASVASKVDPTPNENYTVAGCDVGQADA